MAENQASRRAVATVPCDGSIVKKNSNAIRIAAVLLVSAVLGGLFYRFAHDVRMSLFIALVAAFAGGMFTMISIVTREN